MRLHTSPYTMVFKYSEKLTLNRTELWNIASSFLCTFNIFLSIMIQSKPQKYILEDVYTDQKHRSSLSGYSSKKNL